MGILKNFFETRQSPKTITRKSAMLKDRMVGVKSGSWSVGWGRWFNHDSCYDIEYEDAKNRNWVGRYKKQGQLGKTLSINGGCQIV